jgi:hypothetical protein
MGERDEKRKVCKCHVDAVGARDLPMLGFANVDQHSGSNFSILGLVCLWVSEFGCRSDPMQLRQQSRLTPRRTASGSGECAVAMRRYVTREWKALGVTI